MVDSSPALNLMLEQLIMETKKISKENFKKALEQFYLNRAIFDSPFAKWSKTPTYLWMGEHDSGTGN